MSFHRCRLSQIVVANVRTQRFDKIEQNGGCPMLLFDNTSVIGKQLAETFDVRSYSILFED